MDAGGRPHATPLALARARCARHPWRAAAAALAAALAGGAGWALRGARGGARDAAADAAFARALAGAAPPPACAPPAACGALAFARYEPSAREAEWGARAAAWSADVCAALAAPEQRAAAQAALDAARARHARAGAAAPPGAPDDAAAFSHLVFADAAGAETRVAVHALVGTLRDARSVCPGVGLTPPNGDIFSTEHLVVDVPPAALRAAGGAGSAAARPRAILVDAGATGWGAVTDARYPNTVGMPWLIEAYAARGVAFDDIFAFEATQLPAARFFAGMPARVAAAAHFYNLPVDATRGAAWNPLELLKLVATPADFVVFKLDIDTEAVEEALVLQLLDDDEAAARVDVLLFEHHTSLPAMAHMWGRVDRRSHADSVALFAALRRRGIQAQAWP